MTLDEMRADFIAQRRGSIALPITGIIVYSTAALLSLLLPVRWHNLALTLGFWSIMPIGALIMKIRGEQAGLPAENPLFRLSNYGRWMALATWAIHIPVWIYAPQLFPISVGIGFALHWVIFSWTLMHPVGFLHVAMRICFVLIGWHLAPDNRMGGVALGVALAYTISVFQLSRIDWTAHFAKVSGTTEVAKGASES